MELARVIESLDGVEDAVKSLYEPTEDGKFALKIKVKDDEDALAAVRGNSKKILEEKKALEKRLSEIESARKAEAEEKERIAAEAAAKAGDVKGITESYEKKLAALTNDITAKEQKYVSMIEDMTVGATATKIAADIAVKGSAEVLIPHIRARLKTVFEGDTVKVVVIDKAGNLTADSVEDLVKEIKSNDAFAPLIAGSGGSGAGAHGGANGGSSGGDPTKRTKKYETDAEFAERQRRIIEQKFGK